MKPGLCSTLLVAFSVLAAGIGLARAQALSGVVRFANDPASGVNAPFYAADGTTRLSGATFRAALYAGMPGSPPESWSRISGGQPFRSQPWAGYWTSLDVPLALVMPGGSLVVLQVRFWDSVDGTFNTYEEAEANGAAVGVSRAIMVVLNNPSTPTPMTGLQSAG